MCFLFRPPANTRYLKRKIGNDVNSQVDDRSMVHGFCDAWHYSIILNYQCCHNVKIKIKLDLRRIYHKPNESSHFDGVLIAKYQHSDNFALIILCVCVRACLK